MYLIDLRGLLHILKIKGMKTGEALGSRLIARQTGMLATGAWERLVVFHWTGTSLLLISLGLLQELPALLQPGHTKAVIMVRSKDQ